LDERSFLRPIRSLAVTDNPRKTSRRDFLKGRSAARVLADAAAAPPEAGLTSPPAARSLLIHVGREAMACEFEVVLNAGQYRSAPDAAVAALDLVERLEAQLTVYRDTSEVSRLNHVAADEPVPVEAQLFDLLRKAKLLSEQTGGSFDITSGPLTKVWGFYRRQGQMPHEAAVSDALSRVGHQWLRVDESNESVRFERPGMEINLGAIGKGYALDRAAGLLLSEGVADFMLHGGNSSVLASGSRMLQTSTDRRSEGEGSSVEAGWTVALRHPLRPDVRLAEFRLIDRALGTSGSGTQYFHHQGKRYGHILDPRTGWPAEGVLSSTVIAPTAAEADALATALYVMGLDLAKEFIAQHPEYSALMTTASTRAGGIELHPLNLPEQSWRVLEP
jgi:FAD:protein FMN transferase